MLYATIQYNDATVSGIPRTCAIELVHEAAVHPLDLPFGRG